MVSRYLLAAFLGACALLFVPAQAQELRPAPVVPAGSTDGSGLHSAAAAPASSFGSSQGTMSQNGANNLGSQGILSKSQGHKPGVLSRLGGAAGDVGHATLAGLSVVVFNHQNVDLPPSDEDNAEWPFPNPHRKTLYSVTWADGSESRINRLPDGSYQIMGSGRHYILQPESDGSFAMMGDYGSMASMTPRPGGGYIIVKADGTREVVEPREGGGYVITSKNGVVATIIPGVAGSHHIRGSGYSSGFLQ